MHELANYVRREEFLELISIAGQQGGSDEKKADHKGPQTMMLMGDSLFATAVGTPAPGSVDKKSYKRTRHLVGRYAVYDSPMKLLILGRKPKSTFVWVLPQFYRSHCFCFFVRKIFIY